MSPRQLTAFLVPVPLLLGGCGSQYVASTDLAPEFRSMIKDPYPAAASPSADGGYTLELVDAHAAPSGVAAVMRITPPVDAETSREIAAALQQKAPLLFSISAAAGSAQAVSSPEPDEKLFGVRTVPSWLPGEPARSIWTHTPLQSDIAKVTYQIVSLRVQGGTAPAPPADGRTLKFNGDAWNTQMPGYLGWTSQHAQKLAMRAASATVPISR